MLNFIIGATTCSTATGGSNQADWKLIMGRCHFLNEYIKILLSKLYL